MNRLVFLRTSTMKKLRGAGLVEVLVTLLILSTSLMSLAALQARSLQYNQGAYLRSQANILAYDMLDRMRVNQANAADYEMEAEPFDRAAAVPDPDPIAELDQFEWARDIDARLPAGTGAIALDAATQIYTITISWREINSSGRAEEDTSTFTYQARL